MLHNNGELYCSNITDITNFYKICDNVVKVVLNNVHDSLLCLANHDNKICYYVYDKNELTNITNIINTKYQVKHIILYVMT